MRRIGVLVADSARCRLFSVKTVDNDNFDLETSLSEALDLANPEANLSGQEVFSNTKSGRNRAPGGGPAHGYDDHRDHHHTEMLRRFARAIADGAQKLVRDHELVKLIVIAEPRMLGVLRPELKSMLMGLVLEELPEDLSTRSAPQITRRLAERGLLPESARPSGVAYRPRGQPL